MAKKHKYSERNVAYQETVYERQQMRDTLKGSVAVKNMGELYLPMPSAWNGIEPTLNTNKYENPKASAAMASADYLPWNHKNPAYRAYISRARFPDITANALRMCIGVTTKYESKVELPKEMEYLIEKATNDGKSLDGLYAHLISEALSVSKCAIVVGYFEKTGQFYLTTYNMESNIDWAVGYDSDNNCVLEMSKFIESVSEDGDETIKEFFLGIDERTGAIKPHVRTYTEQDQEPVPNLLSYRGKEYDMLPVFYAGAFQNIPGPENIPLLSISDIAISLYQEDADLRQAHFMTCNPTLFIFGIRPEQKPAVIGSQVCVAVDNPNARAEYPATDTSALAHVMDYMKEIKIEASVYGAALLVSPAKESGEALSIREANRGASLVHIVNCVSRAMTDALKFIARMTGKDESAVSFEGSVEFAEALLNAQDLTALVSTWMAGGIDLDILLDNIRSANYIKDGRTNQQIKDAIEQQKPPADPNVDENGNVYDKEKEKNPAEKE